MWFGVPSKAAHETGVSRQASSKLGVSLQRRARAADIQGMSVDPNEQWARVTIDESLVGRRPGGSAHERARALRRAHPVRTTVARLLGVHTDERVWRKGETGERVTAWWLGRLPVGWHVFNDIPVGDRGANIDHVIVGPGGVFTVNAKNLTGKVWVARRSIRHNGHQTSFLSKAASEATRASRLLTTAVGHGIDVRPVLAILADGWTIKELPSDVFVGAPRSVRDWLLRQPATCSSAEVTAICAAAARPTTWRDGSRTGGAVGRPAHELGPTGSAGVAVPGSED
jgi:nuclease-like protein